MAVLSQETSYDDFKKAYCEEQLDRQVLWILKQIPELDFEDKSKKTKPKISESERSRVSFDCGKTGFCISMFFVMLNKVLMKAMGNA